MSVGPVVVVGPAYLDRVVRVDRPLLDPSEGGPLDRSVEGRDIEGEGSQLRLLDPEGGSLTIDPPQGWPGPRGTVALSSVLGPCGKPRSRHLTGMAWLDDLGGMGAGYAKALQGTLVSALGPESDPISRAVIGLLKRAGIAHRPVVVQDQAADWTLLVTSGPHGDKLPIGFRGCHAKASPRLVARAVECSAIRPALVVAAGLDNRTALGVLRAFPGSIRLLAPSIRGMGARDAPPGGLAGSVDVLACNREEWLAATPTDRQALEACLSLLSVTDGPRGAAVYHRGEGGSWLEIRVPAFPRRRPPVDTNRAGEAFASTLVATLAAEGWRPGEALDTERVHRAAIRASAASALVLDLERFGFPTPDAIDEAVRVGVVGGDDRIVSDAATEGTIRP